MYEKHFQLRERPFALSPDPEYLYPSKVHQEALSYLRYGIEGHAGFVMITGEIGSGKTTMLQSLLRRVDQKTTVARIVNTMLEPHELLEAIVLDFGLDATGKSKPALLHALAEFLVRQRQAGRLTLLVIDEGQNLSFAALEEVRMLSNLETEKSKLIQIVMVGQPELREKLRLPQLEQLRQRITVSYHLQPLDVEETARYINHRLKRAAIGAPLEFPEDVTRLIHQRSRGVPRIINVIADAALLFAYGIDRRTVDVSVTMEALAELDTTGVLASYHSESTQAAHAASVTVAEAQDAMRLTDEVRQRERALSDRERDLRDRELSVQAQQRVLEEQARLLATTPQTIAPAAAARAVAMPTRPTADPKLARPVARETLFEPLPPAIPALRSAGQGSVTGMPASRPDQQGNMRTAPPSPWAAARAGTGSTVPPGTGRVLVRSAVQVQQFDAPTRVRHMSMWARIRRVFFGVNEPEARA